VREWRVHGSVRGAAGNGRPCRRTLFHLHFCASVLGAGMPRLVRGGGVRFFSPTRAACARLCIFMSKAPRRRRRSGFALRPSLQTVLA
jgi:hypothetical protein